MKRNKLKQMYYKDPNTFGYWKNKKGEPTAEYIKWLEDTLMKQLTLGVAGNQREQLVCDCNDEHWVYDESGVDMYCSKCEPK